MDGDVQVVRDILIHGGVNHVGGRFVPFAAGVDAGVGANGSDDGVSAGVDAVGFFDEKFEGTADVLAAAIEEAGGARVSVDDPSFGEVKFLGDENGMLPAEKFLVDFVAVGMLADLAFAGMALEGSEFARGDASGDGCGGAGRPAGASFECASWCRGRRGGEWLRGLGDERVRAEKVEGDIGLGGDFLQEGEVGDEVGVGSELFGGA